MEWVGNNNLTKIKLVLQILKHNIEQDFVNKLAGMLGISQEINNLKYNNMGKNFHTHDSIWGKDYL